MEILKTNGLKQLVLLILIAFVGIVLIVKLQYFIPGFLAAVTFYILLRQPFFNLTIRRRWKKWVAALTLIILSFLVLLLPLWMIVQLLVPKFDYAFKHTDQIILKGTAFVDWLKLHVPLNIKNEQIEQGLQQAIMIIPMLLNATINATANVLVNTLVGFFILYFMLMSGRNMEKKILSLLPLQSKNTDALWNETRNMVVSNAIGIPILMICQCIIAIIGYWIFGVEQAIVWGILTGVASMIPMVGTMIVWVPICIIMIAEGRVGMGIGLTLYCAIVVSNIDNVLRFTILKRIGNVHPLITVFGVIVGVQLFGIMGIIFGPLLIVYFILLIKIYRLEFSSKNILEDEGGETIVVSE
jgi:predicted PurR-regulated permease PerM